MPTLINLSGFQQGVAEDETGINVNSFTTDTKPEFKNFVMDKSGVKRGFAVGPGEQTITISGEISGSSGIMAAIFTTAVSLANTVNYAGVTTGDIYLDSSNIVENHTALKTGTWTFSRNTGIVD